MYCPYCGEQTEYEAKFCGHCGKSLVTDCDNEHLSEGEWRRQVDNSSNQLQLVDQDRRGNKKTIVITAAVVAVAVAMILIGVFAMTAGGGSKNETQDLTNASSGETHSLESSGNQTNGSSEVKEHKILFETAGGTTYEPMSVTTGDVVTSPHDPVKNKAVFEGWYTDQNLTVRASFPYTVKSTDPETIVLYAKWRSLDSKFFGGSNSNNPYSGNGYTGSDQPTYYKNCIFPYSSSEYLTETDVKNLTDWQIQRAINEIYARNGYIFQADVEEKTFFESQSWYHGTDTDQAVVQSRFNDFERANVRILTSNR